MDMMLLLLTIGIFTGFFVQTITGFAGALIALPFLLFVMPLPDAIGYLSIFYFISSPIHVYKEWKYIDKPLLKKLALSSFFGLLIGIIVLAYGQPVILKKALGVFIILFVLNSLKANKEIQLISKMKYFFGFLGGFFSGVFSTGGPLYLVIVKNETSDVKTLRATMFGVLGLITFMRIPVLAFEGILTVNQLYNSLYVLPFFILALILGKKVYLKLNELFLKRIMLGLLFLSGIMLLIKN
ncbi:sulfite exporter TauE/SafE family protein [Flavobacterium sp. ZE23DGlu08]|uniref:sulfite exporter TauE/SafE family protein n=1 Tax=Flavobacterium sp. ZE23DGlu08 TaxID=3059026 RepID=UPI00265E5130|nr:sulfite exporter TauE/SafE family protein [Flavobacterium sp. ZE23DGlu08]WKL44060.1 sulfite exporter TauE/SafE family protein [Flavobacterium sp. ZE23DGlu08]